MNYCSIQDAWGDTSYISDQYKKYDNNIDHNHKIVENFQEARVDEPTMLTDQLKNDKPLDIQKPTNINYDYTNKISCDDILNHIEKCKYCRKKIMDRFSSNIITTFKNYVKKNKDIIFIVLVSLFILIFFNLLVSLFFR
jgi:hypothetical protein